MYEARDYVAVLEVEVVVRAKYVGGDNAGERAAILLVVGSAEKRLVKLVSTGGSIQTDLF